MSSNNLQGFSNVSMDPDGRRGDVEPNLNKKYPSLDSETSPGFPTPHHVRRDSWDSTIKRTPGEPPSPSPSSRTSGSVLGIVPKGENTARRNSWDNAPKTTPGGDEPQDRRVIHPNDVPITIIPDPHTGSRAPSVAGSTAGFRSTEGLVEEKPEEETKLPKCMLKIKEFFTQPRYEKPRAAFLIIVLIIIVIAMIVGPVVYHQQQQAKAAKTAPGTPVANIFCGAIEGVKEDGGFTSFKGIPYANPPVGQHRWEHPHVLDQREDCDKIYKQKPLKATQFRERCYQELLNGEKVGSEDCLFLNIWTPYAHEFEDHKQPVIVYIHDGDLLRGGGDDVAMFNLSSLVSINKVVVVTFNYRLNVLGFLALEALAAPGDKSGNYGLADQIAALTWIRGNIHKFGGDPNRVTVFGLGSGGTSILAMLSGRSNTNVFQRAWIMSGGLLAPRSRDLLNVYKDNEIFMNHTGCHVAESKKDCLLQLSPAQALEHLPINEGPLWGHSHSMNFPMYGKTTGGVLYVDGVTVEKDPWLMLKDGQLNTNVPLVLGNALNEADLNPPYFKDAQVMTSTEKQTFQDRLKSFNITNQLDTMKDDIYSEEGFTYLVALVRSICPYNEIAKLAAVHQSAIYRYIVSAKPQTKYDPFGLGFQAQYAFHGQDMIAAFDGIYDKFADKYEPGSTIFSQYIKDALVGFAFTGQIKEWQMYPGYSQIEGKTFIRKDLNSASDKLNQDCAKLAELYPDFWPSHAWVN